MRPKPRLGNKKLTDPEVRKAQPRDKIYRLLDGGGLYLEVRPNGSKLWMFRYRLADGGDTRISLGMYPEVSLSRARLDRDQKQLSRKRDGVDPAAERRLERLRQRQANADNFEAVAREWHEKQKNRWKASHAEKVIRWLEADVFPWLGSRPVAAITAPDMLAVAKRVESRGAAEKAHRVKNICSMIFRYAVATGRAQNDPTWSLKGALQSVVTKHHPSITDPKGVGALMRAIKSYKGSSVVRAALQFAPLVFVRPGELRNAEWKEFDLEAAEWRIPAEKMKMGEQHFVPLSVQSIAILRDLHAVTGQGPYVFPSERTNKRPMSENTINVALRILGYTSEQMTGHGFRSMASTLLHELGWAHHVIERQLAHAERNKVVAAYNHAQYLIERRKMMQSWSTYLESLQSSNVIQGPFAKVA